MKITKIKIENVKGIESREFVCLLHPNTPNIFVAPNGFGKTSFATAFKSLKRTKIDIGDEDIYKGDPTRVPMIELTDDSGNIYMADASSNSINSTFSVAVITSQVKAKGSSRNLGTFTATSAFLTIEPIIIYDQIPSKDEFSYSLLSMKGNFTGSFGKLFINLKDLLSSHRFVVKFIGQAGSFDKLLQTRNNRKINDCIQNINRIQGTKVELLGNIDLSEIETINEIGSLNEQLGDFFGNLKHAERIVNIIQLLNVYNDNRGRLSKILKYYQYIADKAELGEMIGFFNSTWKDIKATTSKSKLVINFPKATQISNGERDILCFIGKLFESRSRLQRKDKSVLIIDEVFDYLDDANLIAAQYFLTKFIAQYKNFGKELFAIILTHLDPAFFNTFNFSSKNIVYLDRHTQSVNKHKINNVLKKRNECKKEDPLTYECISSNFLHYSNSNPDQSEYLSRVGADAKIHTASGFRKAAIKELKAYQEGQPYDLALVCCGLRLTIERMAFEQLEENEQGEFLRINTTVSKLAFAKEKGAHIPEAHFLLSIIYNEAMHLDAQCQKLHPIGYKLKNKVICHMIKQVTLVD